MEYDTPAQRRLARQVSNEIDELLKRERAEQLAIKGPKILLLGSADSGKTTVLKQIKILHGNGFPDKERQAFRRKILANIIDSMRALVNALSALGVPLGEPNNQLHIKTFQKAAGAQNGESLEEDVIGAIKELWADRGIQQCYARSNEFFIQDTADYFLNDIAKFTDPSFIPSDEDILHTRFRTTEISETCFNIDKLTYRIYDVGGQRSDRLFWAPYFEDQVHAILFITSLAAYDQMLVEDRTVNRMLDALVLFETITNNPLLKKVSIMLFLNKMDLFERKLKYSPVKKFFPDYEGSNDLKSAGRYFKTKFHAQNKTPEKKIYTHFTTSTDTKHMKVIISAVRDIVTRLSLQASGYL
ncbi:uncharacterized protein SPPG_08686 [Spizellomyces punctatus DAOM BR117]|uniref:Uncharacterized protein n=1 Tax=Spizellomyces punctatus (strain DAOM BR117) TaxID=645134 RepID=A0A0L0H5C5_SPIPD|nr:uncharacterized protein SPPG_08686 [Spizellomyces punctatus DAOM BR117]KNC95933.1 hypothetical protein SPPG_08686 [Spizellomyces punctatus DAOM BR117]|eukprot:XP_016603973.1 hypothetical protein SPPG_08686 [Spizellomyces punctatus DAOM BR117]